jgi:predicted porin
LGWTANGFHVGFIYEDREIDNLDMFNPILPNDGDSWQLSASYTAGNNTFKIAYGEADGFTREGETNLPVNGLFTVAEGEQWSIGVDHKLSNRTTVYAAYTDFNNSQKVIPGFEFDWDAFSVGIIHSF